MQEKNEMSQILRGIMDCVAYSKRYRAKHGAWAKHRKSLCSVFL